MTFNPPANENWSTAIDVYPDSTLTLGSGEKFVIGTPVDTPITLCKYTNDEDTLTPLTPEDKEFSKVLSVAGEVFEEEFEGECIVMPTSGVLTVTGEWDFEEEEEEEEASDDGADEGEEPVEMLLAFNFNDREYKFVRLVDPVMLVGRIEGGEGGKVTLLGDDDGDILEEIEEAFLKLAVEKEED